MPPTDLAVRSSAGYLDDTLCAFNGVMHSTPFHAHGLDFLFDFSAVDGKLVTLLAAKGWVVRARHCCDDRGVVDPCDLARPLKFEDASTCVAHARVLSHWVQDHEVHDDHG